MFEDAIGLLILAIVAIALLVLLGAGILFGCDLISSAFSWFSVGPAPGWALLGTLVGALYGIITGMKARGKSDDLRKIYFGAALAAALMLAAGVASPAGRHLIGL